MHVIDCHFARLRDLPAHELLNGFGVYVIWDGKAKARPSYIGEGDIWNRMSSHRNVFEKPIHGYIAVLADSYSSRAKDDCQIVEAVLLEIAEETDRLPSDNKRGGNGSLLNDLFRRHGVVRINVSGWDPLKEPGTGNSIPGRKVIRATPTEDWFELEHDWRLRRLRKPVG